MLCEKCHKNLATVRYAEVVDGRVKDLHLCPECLAQHQQKAGIGFELTKPAPVRLRKEGTARGMQLTRERCKSCGSGLRPVLESGKMGCGTCYETFTQQAESMLEGLHIGVRHRGKTPHVDDVRARVRTDLQTKRSLLRSALRTENYEEAAHLRDEIRVLETQLTPSEEEN